MKTIVQSLLLLLAILPLSACVTTGPSYAEMKDRIPEIAPGAGRIYFFRRPGFVGGGLQPEILLNGDVVGKSLAGGFFFVDRPAGKYLATYSDRPQRKLAITVERGATVFVETFLAGEGRLGMDTAEFINPPFFEKPDFRFTGESGVRK